MFSNKFSTINLTHLPYFVTVSLMVIDIQKHSFIVAGLLQLFQSLKLPAYG